MHNMYVSFKDVTTTKKPIALAMGWLVFIQGGLDEVPPAHRAA